MAKRKSLLLRLDPAVHDALARELNAPDLAVRRAVFLAVGKLAAPAAADPCLRSP